MLVQDLKARWGSVDILVNSAGGALHTPHILEEVQEKDWNLVVDVNLKGTFLCCQAVIPEMAKQRKGTIVNMSALAGHWRASLAGVQYVAAKAGVEGLTRQLAYDWGQSGIRVNAIAPTVNDPLWHAFFAGFVLMVIGLAASCFMANSTPANTLRPEQSKVLRPESGVSG